MSNGSDWRASRSLDLVNKLKRTIADYSKREDQISRDLRVRRYNISQRHQEATDRRDSTRSARLAQIEEATQTALDRTKSIYDKRQARVERAHLMATRHLPKRVKEVRTGWVGDLQMRRYKLEKQLMADLSSIGGAESARASKVDEGRTSLRKLANAAKKYFGGYGAFRGILRQHLSGAESAPAPRGNMGQLQAQLTENLNSAREQLRAFRKLPVPRFFQIFPPLLLAAVLLVVGVAISFALGFNATSHAIGGGVAAVLYGVALVLYFGAKKKLEPDVISISSSLAEASRYLTACINQMGLSDGRSAEELQAEFDATVSELDAQKDKADDVAAAFEKKMMQKLQDQLPRLTRKISEARASRERVVRVERQSLLEELNENTNSAAGQTVEKLDQENEALDAEEGTKWTELDSGWKAETTPLWEEVRMLNQAVQPNFPAWTTGLVDAWKPGKSFLNGVPVGKLRVDLDKIFPTGVKSSRLALPEDSPTVDIPLSLSFPDEGSLLFETQGEGEEAVMSVFNNIILRLLATNLPGRLSFTIIDPVGLGKNFAGLMHLSDYEESLINRRIWTQRDQIDERLAELSEHIEKVIQMYLRSEYENIAQYNEQAGSVAEKYHFLVIADFPVNISESAAMKLQNIITSGARCGVFTLIHWDQRQSLPDGFVADELRKNSVRIIRERSGGFSLGSGITDASTELLLDQAPEAEMAAALVHKIGKSSIDSNRVEVPFSQIAPAPSEYWTNETTSELRIAIGRTGATKHQMLAIGKGTRQHALFAGKTGSGKSTLFHVIITNLALACSPDEVEFYLIDFKKGVEFKCYATKKLPHAKVVAIESDREFALSVLQRVDAELKRRGDIFRALGVQDLAGYKRAGGTEPMPRSLLLIDEFQEFFVDDDSVAQSASLLFDRIVRQGRAFGIHVLLGSQTLGGAYSLARATLGQMVIRVALQCNEADAYLIMDENNPAPRLLSRPGEGIYNDAAGAVEGNNPFQVVWLADDDRDAYLDKINELAQERYGDHPSPIVFEGNAPADIRENNPLRLALSTPASEAPLSPRCWLGAPNSIKGPTEVVFERQSGNHLLIVGQREEAALSMMGLSLIALAAQHPVGTAKFVFIHGSAPGSADALFIERVVEAVDHDVIVSRGNDLGEILGDITTDMKARASGDSSGAATFVFVHGLHKFKKLRQEDEFSFSFDEGASSTSPSAMFADILTEGSSQGVHLIVTVDTYNNLNRSLSRKALGEFEKRVIFQMSANDSASLIDSPKASNLGLHRAIYFNEHEGALETFRPYALPSREWLEQALP